MQKCHGFEGSFSSRPWHFQAEGQDGRTAHVGSKYNYLGG
jgi:hypothetical protein